MGNKQKGFTYLEVMLALIIIGIVIVPIGSSMVSSIKTVLYSKTIHQAALNAETLMKVVKEQINEDVIDEKDNYPKYIKIGSNKVEDYSLQNFLNMPTKMIDILKESQLKEFQYVVGVWQLERDMAKKNDVVSNRVLLLSTEETVPTDNIDGLTQLMIQNKDTLIPTKPVECNKVIVDSNSLDSGDGNIVIQLGVNPTNVENEEKNQKDYYGIYKGLAKDKVNAINVKIAYSNKDLVMTTRDNPGENKQTYNTVYVDGENLTDKASGGTTRTIRIINEASKPLCIKVRDPHDQVLFVQDTGEIMIHSIMTMQVPHNYVVGILVKDNKGKILEKLVDLYSAY